MNLIRTVLLDSSADGLTKGIGFDGAYRRVSLDGRYQETLQGYLYQHFGFSSAPEPGMELVLLKDGNSYLTVAENDGSNRPEIDSGEVMVYRSPTQYIYFKADKSIEITAGKSVITITDDGVVEVVNDNGGIVMAANGQVDINGGNLTVDP